MALTHISVGPFIYFKELNILLEQLKDLCDVEGVRIHEEHDGHLLVGFHIWNDIENEYIMSIEYGDDILEYYIRSHTDERRQFIDNPTFEDLREKVFSIIESS